jgi:hypothetical protein
MNPIFLLKKWVNDPEFQVAFNAYLTAKLDLVHKGLEQASGDEFKAFQGEARVLRKLLKLREEINGADRVN